MIAGDLRLHREHHIADYQGTEGTPVNKMFSDTEITHHLCVTHLVHIDN